jgi:hypothetical protein
VEVVEYLRGAGRRRWILVGLPLVLVALVVPWALTQPQTFRTVSTVSVQPSTGYTGPSAIRSFVDTFVQVSETAAVLERAAADSGIPVEEFRGSLSVTPVGGSPLVEVEVATSDRRDGQKVTGAIIRAALAIPLDALIAQTKVELEAVQDDVQRVAEQIATIERESGELIPSEAYRVAVAEVARIESALAAGGSGPGGEAVSEADLAEAQDTLRETRQLAQDYQSLLVQRSQKQNQVTIVEARLSQFEERKNQIDGAVFDTTTNPVSQRPLLIQAIVAALVAGVLLASATLVIIERWRRRQSGSVPDAATESPAAAVAAAGPPDRGREADRGLVKPPKTSIARERRSTSEEAEEPTLRKAPSGDSRRVLGAGRDR